MMMMTLQVYVCIVLEDSTIELLESNVHSPVKRGRKRAAPKRYVESDDDDDDDENKDGEYQVDKQGKVVMKYSTYRL